jgi:hypothetical protein
LASVFKNLPARGDVNRRSRSSTGQTHRRSRCKEKRDHSRSNFLRSLRNNSQGRSDRRCSTRQGTADTRLRTQAQEQVLRAQSSETQRISFSSRTSCPPPCSALRGRRSFVKKTRSIAHISAFQVDCSRSSTKSGPLNGARHSYHLIGPPYLPRIHAFSPQRQGERCQRLAPSLRAIPNQSVHDRATSDAAPFRPSILISESISVLRPQPLKRMCV